jgi:hypothetical protein
MGEVREMRSAKIILGIIRERGKRGLPLQCVYRLLFKRELFLLAYGRIAKNAGALTPGVTKETADGMSLVKIDAIIEALRSEPYRWSPVRRTYIEKKHSTKRSVCQLQLSRRTLSCPFPCSRTVDNSCRVRHGRTESSK